MEAIFRQAKEAQEKSDQAFEEEQRGQGSNDFTKSVTDSKPRRGSQKISGSSRNKDNKLLTPGSTVRAVSGTFAEFVGSLKKLNHKTGKVYSFSHK